MDGSMCKCLQLQPQKIYGDRYFMNGWMGVPLMQLFWIHDGCVIPNSGCGFVDRM